MSYSKEELVKYRIERAWESLQDAQYLLEEERWNAAANRMYYACFYSTSAYLVLHRFNEIYVSKAGTQNFVGLWVLKKQG